MNISIAACPNDEPPSRSASALVVNISARFCRRSGASSTPPLGFAPAESNALRSMYYLRLHGRGRAPSFTYLPAIA